jgi:hypothetical protein
MSMKILLFFGMALFIGFGHAEAQLVKIKGTIRDEKKLPIVAASVMIKGSGSGVSTDSLGQFQMEVKATAVLLISAIGYTDQTVKIRDLDDQLKVDLVMHPDPKLLKEAEVRAKPSNAAEKQMEPINQQIVGSTVTDFRESQNLFTGQTITEKLVPNGPGATLVHQITSSPNGTIYTGAAIPVFNHKEDTKGTRYLFEKWVSGTVIDSAGNTFHATSFVYNYDKVTRNLLLTQDMNQVVEVDKAIIHSFTLKADGRELSFERVNVIDNSSCLQVLVKAEGKYALYKYVKAKFVKSDYHSDGMVESGNPYDEYVDESRYFILYPDGTTFHELPMRMKPLREMLSFEAVGKAAAYFKDHRYEFVNPDFLVGLVTAMNQ